jgi:predicted transcriptional regulator
MLRVMLDKRLVKRKTSGRAAEWSAAVSRDAAAKSMVGKLIDNVFAGSAGLLALHLVEGGKLSKEELAELKQLIEEESSRQGTRHRG